MGRTLQIPVARAYVPLLAYARYKGAFGGRGSMKSHFFAEQLIEKAKMIYGLRFVCVREVQKSLDQSVKLLIEDKIKTFGLSQEFGIMHTQIITPGNGVIIFQGMQDHTADSIKSLEGYDGAWIEEAQTLSKRSLELLRPTIRKEYPDGTESEIWASWNPRKPDDPIDDFLRNKKNPPPSSIVIGTTYRDNPYFPEVLRKEMEWDKKTHFETYQHVWEGLYESRTDAQVFKNWQIAEFEAPPNTSFMVGSDWGYSVDPSTLVRCYEQRIDPSNGQPWPRKRLYIDYELYQIGVEIDYMPAFFDGLVCGCPLVIPGQVVAPCRKPEMHGWARRVPIVADSARPETISFLRRHGYPHIDPAKKGAGSVREGVIFLQGYDIFIHKRCTQTAKEFGGFSYVRDKLTQKPTNELEDKKNHIIDPTRYALEQLRGILRVSEAQWG